MAAALGAALAVLKRAGAEVVEVTVPDTHDIIAHWAVLCAAETAVAHEATYPSRAGEYGAGPQGVHRFRYRRHESRRRSREYLP